MDIQLTERSELELEKLARERGQRKEEAARLILEDALEQARNHEQWFIQEVKKGLEAADRGEVVDHAQVGNEIRRRYSG